ncbi:hypothetical protein JOQ06_023952, partial [Pogonophryne albipinna]
EASEVPQSSRPCDLCNEEDARRKHKVEDSVTLWGGSCPCTISLSVTWLTSLPWPQSEWKPIDEPQRAATMASSTVSSKHHVLQVSISLYCQEHLLKVFIGHAIALGSEQ